MRAAQLVHGLVEAATEGIPGRDLLRFAGAIDAESTCEMEEAIEDGCERINLEAWWAPGRFGSSPSRQEAAGLEVAHARR